MFNLMSVIWIDQQYVGPVLGTLAVVALGLAGLSLVVRDQQGFANANLLRLAGMAAIAFVTLGISAL